jgi:hypothetical protein
MGGREFGLSGQTHWRCPSGGSPTSYSSVRRQIVSNLDADEPGRRRSRWWVIPALIALVVGGTAGLIAYTVAWADARADRADQQSDGYLKAHAAFVADVEAGRLEQAYQSTTPAFRRRVSREEFDERARRYRAFKERPPERGGSASSSGPTGGDYRGPNQMILSETAEYADGSQTEVSITVVFEDSFFDRRPPPPRVGDFAVESKPTPPQGIPGGRERARGP